MNFEHFFITFFPFLQPLSKNWTHCASPLNMSETYVHGGVYLFAEQVN